MNSQLLLLLASIYGGLLFFVAWRAEGWRSLSNNRQAIIYSLSIAVYCSSWTFFGAVGTALEDGWNFITIYLGPILLFVFGWPFLHRLLVMCSRNKVTSIADFIGSRYGKNQLLAAIVTLVAVIGSLPYIALQLKAVTMAWNTVNGINPIVEGVSNTGTSFIISSLMALFAIIFGTRVIDGPRRHTGMVSAIALESFVKLVAFAAVSFLALRWLLVTPDVEWKLPPALMSLESLDANFLTQLFLGTAAIVCLPRQFHVTAVEHHNSRDVRFARWIFPLYLGFFSLLIIPIVIAGQQMFAGTSVAENTFVLMLPLNVDSPLFASLAFVGGLSAATGMVVVAAVTLSIMISNELVVPLWLKFRADIDVSQIGVQLRLVRRIAIVGLLLMGWLLENQLSHIQNLAALGLVSFAAAAQTLPAIISALYWQRAHRNGVLVGLLAGIFVWMYCLLLPLLLPSDHTLMVHGPWGIDWLLPTSLFGSGFVGPLSHGVFWSLLFNSLFFVLVSRYSRFQPLDIRQASAFTQLKRKFSYRQQDFSLTQIETSQLQGLLKPLLDEQQSYKLWHEVEQRLGHRLLPNDLAPRFVVQTVEERLASIIGAVSAHRSIELLRKKQPLKLEDFVSLVGGSSRQLRFSQELLQTTLETIPQGISVVDEELKLVAWNKCYEQLFNYPERLLYIGCPISHVYHFNAERGLFGDDVDVDAIVDRRLALLRQGKRYRLERYMSDGKVIEVSGTPMGNGGYVTTYTDITNYQNVLDELEKSRDELEDRVDERTRELSALNKTLQEENRLRARLEKELNAVYDSKSRFLAAASHDLLQPVNAARLFVASLQTKLSNQNFNQLNHDVEYIDSSLASVENLITSLREISRLDSGKLQVKREHFPINKVLEVLAGEFDVLANDRQLTFHWVPSSQWVYSDPNLLRRVLQNFLSNALRYTAKGKVLLGCRRHQNTLTIEVWDTGAGISEQDRQRIFKEFERGSGQDNSSQQGLGLGLAIASRMAQLLGHHLSFDSEHGVGSVFRINIPLGKQQAVVQKIEQKHTELTGLQILCVDNEPAILAGMQSLLEQWGCHVVCAPGLKEALQRWRSVDPPDAILADYHLDDENGLDVLQALSLHWRHDLSGMVISADSSDQLRNKIKAQGYLYLSKPVKPAALRSSLRNLSKRIR